jgi:uncharacterized protein DUF5752
MPGQPSLAHHQRQPSPSRWAKTPFYFNSAEHLLSIERERANTLGELLTAIKTCSDASIFQHTFRTLQEHHFIQEGYSNDFAHWTFFACNENGLAERLSGVDVREFISIHALRSRLIEIMEEYLGQHPTVKDRTALEPFYFCASSSVVVPTAFVARNMDEFARALEQISVHCVHYHFIEARLRLKLNSNDFSMWLEEQMGLKRTAELINRIDIYTSTLQGVRNRIVRIVETTLA